jgi:hypothetical protein
VKRRQRALIHSQTMFHPRALDTLRFIARTLSGATFLVSSAHQSLIFEFNLPNSFFCSQRVDIRRYSYRHTRTSRFYRLRQARPTSRKSPVDCAHCIRFNDPHQQDRHCPPLNCPPPARQPRTYIGVRLPGVETDLSGDTDIICGNLSCRHRTILARVFD